MKRKRTDSDRLDVVTAIALLRIARDYLARGGAPRAEQAVKRALKSAEGAYRHVSGVSADTRTRGMELELRGHASRLRQAHCELEQCRIGCGDVDAHR